MGYALIVAALASGRTDNLAPLFVILIYGTTAAFLASAWGTLHIEDGCYRMGSLVFPKRLISPSLSWAGFYAPLLVVGVFVGFPGAIGFYIPAALLISLVFGAMVAMFADRENNE